MDLSAAYVFGKNNNPFATDVEVDSNAWHVEASYYILPWLIAEARYEELKVEDANDVELLNQKNSVVGLVWTLRANIKLITEAVFYNNEENGFNVRLAFGF